MKKTSDELKKEIQSLKRELKAVKLELDLKNDVLENSLNGFDIVNAEGRLVYVNKTYLKMWGYESVEEIKGMSASLHCADPETPKQIIQAIHEKGECSLEFLARRKDGSTFDVQMWARLAHDANGNEIYPTTSIDISDRKRKEAELREAIRARDEFLSIASHELKTPLTSLKLKTQMLARKIEAHGMNLPLEEVQDLLNVNGLQVDRLSRLVDDMLDIARLNTGKFTIRRQEGNLKSVFNNLMARYREQLEVLGIQPVLEKFDEVKGQWDLLRLEQVLENLLTNALKYGNKKPFYINLFQENLTAVFSIRDEGPGISLQDQKRIFERYERAVSANEVSGLGLGLYISRLIVEMHQGTLEVKSTLGEGSTFTMRIPLS